jgi:hypothetical protein
MYIKSESVPNEIDESDSPFEKPAEQRIWTWRGIVIDLREGQYENAYDSTRVNSESVSNEIEESNVQSEYQPEQRINAWRNWDWFYMRMTKIIWFNAYQFGICSKWNWYKWSSKRKRFGRKHLNMMENCDWFDRPARASTMVHFGEARSKKMVVTDPLETQTHMTAINHGRMTNCRTQFCESGQGGLASPWCRWLSSVLICESRPSPARRTKAAWSNIDTRFQLAVL